MQKSIRGFENYEVSDDGTIINKRTNRILKWRLDKNGYARVNLCKEHKSHTVLVHRLVADAFIDNPNKYQTVDHIDRNKLNNSLSNLRWANMSTQISNRDHSYLIGNKYAKGVKSPRRIPVRQLLNNAVLSVYDCADEAERVTGISACNIRSCCRGVRYTAGGYDWQYAEQ